ncbi:hypothetical protein [Deinococcus peraridilitoris]|uniref:hypothetical protein n=1 Tax=Deinococcus peraridilitoris TaxID=432329 RepID=UPI0002F405B5|nr:hypothetical protein [Deinococcus peraridilitoris]
MLNCHSFALALFGPVMAGGTEGGARQEGTLNVNGAQIHYVSQGRKTPLLLHGYPLSGEPFVLDWARSNDLH